MNFEQDDGLIELDQEELELLGEPRSPIDYRVAPHLYRRARRLANACSDEFERRYFGTDDGSDDLARSERGEEMQRMQIRESKLRELALGLSDVATQVELEEVFEVEQG